MNQNIDITQLLQMAAAQHQKQQTPSKGLSYWEALSIALIVLNATEFISIAWVWTVFPIFIPYICYGLIMLIGYIISKFVKR